MSAPWLYAIPQARRCVFVLLALWLSGLADCRAQNPVPERIFAFPEAVITRALGDLDAYSDARLPGVDGFVMLAGADAGRYGRPSYRFRIEMHSESANQTRVKVEARITAWYQAYGVGHSGYVSVPSNGRLECDLLDHLKQHLEQGATGPAQGVSTLDDQISRVRSLRQAAQQRQSELQSQIQELEKTLDAPSSNLEVVAVQETGVPVMDAPTPSAHRLFRAGPGDEFEVVRGQGAWDQVRVGAASTAWIRRAKVVPIIGNTSAGKPGHLEEPQAGGSNSPFEIIQEEVQPFSGNWSELRGKQTLFVWVQPARGITQPLPGDRWDFAVRIFRERGYVASLSYQPYAGVAVIFDEPEGGVVAATLDGIRRWQNGNTPALAFRKECSMDPPASFIAMSELPLQSSPDKIRASFARP
jgi:hypothetical protein